jgi:flagellar motor component MotA
VNIVLESIRYVNKHDTFVYMDDPELHEESNRHFIKDMFRLVYNNESDLALNASLNGDIDSTQFTLKHKSTFARIALTAPIDYELLYKPNETFIRIDLSCSDGRYAAHSKF